MKYTLISEVPGIELRERHNGQAVFSVDTQVLSVSQAIQQLSAQADILDISVGEPSIDDTVVSLYREFGI